MKFLVSLVVFSLVLNGFASAQTLIQDSCKKATADDPQFNYDLCVSSLTQDPQSKTATTLQGLVLASTKQAVTKAVNLKGIAQKILQDKRFQGIVAEMRTCVELYNNAIGSLNTALASVQAHNYNTAKVNLSAALNALGTCEEGFKGKMQQKSPLTNENIILGQKILIPLDFSNML